MAIPNMLRAIEAAASLRRHQFFVSLLSTLVRPLNILDVGGSYDYWQRLNVDLLGDVRIVLLNLSRDYGVPPIFTSVVGDARDLS